MEERARDEVSGELSFDHLRKRLAEGWRPTAIEWVRPTEGQGGRPLKSGGHEVPYGFRISSDCRRLEQDPEETAVLLAVLEQIVQDRRFTQIAEELNRRHFKTRSGRNWSSAEVFDLLPQLIEVGPTLTKSEEWHERRLHVVKSAEA
jgi:hypothetical protein